MLGGQDVQKRAQRRGSGRRTGSQRIRLRLQMCQQTASMRR
jgi:hypothetical protein